jgi:hypothetical protein
MGIRVCSDNNNTFIMRLFLNTVINGHKLPKKGINTLGSMGVSVNQVKYLGKKKYSCIEKGFLSLNLVAIKYKKEVLQGDRTEGRDSVYHFFH